MLQSIFNDGFDLDKFLTRIGAGQEASVQLDSDSGLATELDESQSVGSGSICCSDNGVSLQRRQQLPEVTIIGRSVSCHDYPSDLVIVNGNRKERIHFDISVSSGHVLLSCMEQYLTEPSLSLTEWRCLCDEELAEAAAVATKMEEEKEMSRSGSRSSRKSESNHSTSSLSRSSSSSSSIISQSSHIDYNEIFDCQPTKRYILAEGPTDSETSESLWRLIWEKGANVLVNLAGIDECCRYWPDAGCCNFGIFQIHLVSNHVSSPSFVIRNVRIELESAGESRTVTIMHFTQWERQRQPDNTSQLLEMRRKLHKTYRGAGPVVIHCSDGRGRSGTFCLLDVVLCRAVGRIRQLNLPATLERLREQRQGLVESREQYEFVVAAVAEEVTAALNNW